MRATATKPASRGRRGAAEARLVLDHVVCSPEAAPVVLAALAAMGRRTLAAEVVVLGRERRFAPLSTATWMSGAVAGAARAAGFSVPAAGAGRCESVHFERFAGPARTALFVGCPTPPAAALGTTCLRAGAIEAAIVLAGGPQCPPSGAAAEVWLSGSLARWVGGCDVALALALPGGAGAFERVTFGGPGLAALSVADRVALVRHAARWGDPILRLPSDDVTRGALAAQRRDHDWKRFDPEPIAGATRVDVDLARIEPMLGDPARPGHVSSVAHLLGMQIGWIVVGSLATYAEVARLARALRGHVVAEGVHVTWVPGSLQAYETAAGTGVLATLRAAGVQVRRDATAARAGLGRGAGAGLACATAPEDPGAGVGWDAGPEVCAAAAIHGRIVDPRASEVEFARDEEPVAYAFDPRWLQGPHNGEEGAWLAGVAPMPLGAALDGPLRGTVLADVGDAVGADAILPEGPRVAACGGDARALAAWLFAGRVCDFAARARAHGGGVLVAGRVLGGGPRAETAALALAACGVRAIAARSYAPEFEYALARAGILPLRWRAFAERDALARGEEIEIPGLPESLAEGKPLVVRNLTRGVQVTLPHDLDEPRLDLLRAGGAVARRARHAA